ncbi:MAG TPA: flavodoxin family protein, partial [Negativicutes bacterium]|nr:flavodoxin family protein [Negativicutes bacterium]
VHLYDLNFKGCVSCFACKRIGSPSYGKCAYKDELTPILEKVEHVDALLLGSPIYLGAATGAMRSFLERLIFQYLVYDENYSSLFKGKISTAILYTMNVNEDRKKLSGYDQHLQITEMMLRRTFGSAESLFVTDTYQFDDYAKYVVTAFDPVAKAKRRNDQFPLDCQKAFDLGVRLVTASATV